MSSIKLPAIFWILGALLVVPTILVLQNIDGSVDVGEGDGDGGGVRGNWWNRVVSACKGVHVGMIDDSVLDGLGEEGERLKRLLEGAERSYEDIKEEYLSYVEFLKGRGEAGGIIPAFEFNHQKTLWLKFYSNPTQSLSRFPKTGRILEDLGAPSAFISILEPGGNFHPHIGYVAGVWRWHLGLIVEEEEEGEKGSDWLKKEGEGGGAGRCHLGVQDNLESLQALNTTRYPPYIFYNSSEFETLYDYEMENQHNSQKTLYSYGTKGEIDEMRKNLADGWKYHDYKAGKSVLFDDNNIHYVQNHLESPRVILIVDIPRLDLPWTLKILNKWLLEIVGKWVGSVKYVFKHIQEDIVKSESGFLQNAGRTTMAKVMGWEEGDEREYFDDGGFGRQ